MAGKFPVNLRLFLKLWIDSRALSISSLADHYGLDTKQLESQYKNHLSNYRYWDQLPHAEDWILFEKNMGAHVGLDETSLSRGELYTILINKEAKGKKGSIIAMIKGTDVQTVSAVLLQLSRRHRFQVREITLDMASNMHQIARICFPRTKLSIQIVQNLSLTS